MTFAVWKRDRPMVPTFDYPVDLGDEDEVKALYGYEPHSPKKVATPSGARHYGQPIGSIIKPDLPHIAGLGANDDGSGLDTFSQAFGMKYNPKNAEHPAVVAARAWKGWGDLPSVDFPLGGKIPLHATEHKVRSKPIKRVLKGEPFRKGYDPMLVVTDQGVIVADGHHRIAMHVALAHPTMKAKVLDMRGVSDAAGAASRLKTIAQRAVEQKKRARLAREKQLDVDAQKIAEQMVAQATSSEEAVSAAVVGAVEAHGGYLEGFEHRVKTVESTKRKIISKARRKNTSAAGGASGISDVLRYTAVFDTDDYSAGARAVLDALGKIGIRPTETNNYWPKGDAYSGLNVLLHGKGQNMELQFHTPESRAAAVAAHDDYELARDETKPLEDRMAAWERMIPIWDEVPQPPGWLDFGSFFIYSPPDQPGRGSRVDKWRAQGLEKPAGGSSHVLDGDEFDDLELWPGHGKHGKPWWKTGWAKGGLPWHSGEKKADSRLEVKADRVRTAAGARHYRQPIGTIIKPDAHLPAAPAGTKVYRHPQGATIHVYPDGSMVAYNKLGKKKSTSATPEKLAAGHGGWWLDEAASSGASAPAAEPDPEPAAAPEPEPEVVDDSSGPGLEQPSAPAPTFKHEKPMKFVPGDVKQIDAYIADLDILFQQKIDGIRAQLVVTPGQAPWFRSSNGGKLVSDTAAPVTKALLKSFPPPAAGAGPSYFVDGEILGGKFHVFDLVVEGNEKMSYEDRQTVAEKWVGQLNSAGIKHVSGIPTAATPDEKRKLYEYLLANGGEGVMAKKRQAPYEPNGRVKHSVKLKFTSTADAVVTAVGTKGHDNYELSMYDAKGNLVPVGNTSALGKAKVGVGDVIEVRYLYQGANGRLVQPTMIRARPERKPEEATTDQLRAVDKTVVDASVIQGGSLA